MSQAQQAQMMKELEELQMRESLKLYNLLSEMCFNKCVNTFHGKELDSEETGCMHTCVGKFMKASTRAGMRFAEHQYQEQQKQQQQQ